MKKTIQDRSEIEKQYQWDLSSMIDSVNTFDQLCEESLQQSKEIKAMEGHIMDSSMSLLHYLNMSDKLERNLEQIYVYAHMLCDQDTTNTENQKLKMKSERLNEEITESLSFIEPEILSVPYEIVSTYIEEQPALQVYRFSLESLFRYQAHTLSKEEEAIIASASNAFGSCDDVFYNLDNADIHLGMVKDEHGQEVELTNSNYTYYMTRLDRRVRKDAFEAMYGYFKGLKNTLAATLKGQIKENFFYSKVRKYANPLTMSLFHDHIDVSVYHNLIDAVHNHMNDMYDYMKIRKKVLGLEEMHMYDIYVDLVKDEPKDIPLEEGKQMVIEALKPLGEQYIEDLKQAFSKHWIDIYPNKGKKSGAYSWGTYDSAPYLLLNYDDTIDSVSTMAHELGHSMHSYYSNQAQPFNNHAYPIFLAEIASTVNEVLLNQYLYDHATTKEEKISYLVEFLDKVRTTIYRQTMFAEFEMLMHEKEENNIPLTEQEFSDTYYQLNQFYYGDNIISDDEIRYEWARIPHFYTSFYVYKYATGLSSAITLAFDILNGVEGARERYLHLLSRGGSDYPLSILKEAGVDMTTKEPIEKALHVFHEKLQELKELCQ